MINLHRDIHSLTDFKRNTNDFISLPSRTMWFPSCASVTAHRKC
jgi:hypothetical protein